MLQWGSTFVAPHCRDVALNEWNQSIATNLSYTLDQITLNTNGCSAYEPIGGVQHWNSYISTSNVSLYTPEVCQRPKGTDLDPHFADYCTCRDACKQAFSFGHERTAFTIVGAGFAIWYIISSIICVCCIKERGQLDGGASLTTPPPLVPSMLNTFNNLPFVMLLPAWACDAVTTGIIASMVSYFVRYVVKPEFQPGCMDGLSDDWWCQSVPVTGLSVTMTLCAAFVFTPAWLFMAKKLGKRQTWLIWSITMAITNAFYIFVGPGDHILCILISGMNGIPFGAKFLADAILADIIDYDEFLTGQRSEATYTMFKSFLPKICAIPAAAIPLALLNVFGHVPPINGRIQRQPDVIATYCQVVTVVIPTLASLVATYFKWKFPLKTKEQCDMIGSGVGKHLLGNSAPEPITNIKYKLEKFKDSELPSAYLLDSFRGIKIIKDLLADPIATATDNILACKIKVIVAFTSICLSIISTYVTTNVNICTNSNDPDSCFYMLEEPKFSFFPVISIICFGMSLTAVAFTLLKWNAAKRLLENIPDRVVLLKVLSQRKVVFSVQEHIRKNTTTRSEETSATKVVPFNSNNDGGEEEEAAMQNQKEKRKPKSFAERRAEMEEEDSKENMEEETKEKLDAGPDFEGKWAL